MSRNLQVIAGAVFALLTSAALAEGRVQVFEGTRNTLTREFEIEGPWIMTWRISSDFPDTLGFEMHLVDAVTRAYKGKVLKRKRTGNGIRLFRDTGRFRLRIDSSFANWHVRIEEISEEEAAEYVPL